MGSIPPDAMMILLFIAALFIVGAAMAYLKITQALQSYGVQSNVEDMQYTYTSVSMPVKEVPLQETVIEEIDIDSRIRTTQDAAKINQTIPLPQLQKNGSIPLLYNGKDWLHADLTKDNHWGVFGTTGSGKGNILQFIALAALELGKEAVSLTVLDGKGGLDYAFCEQISHAALYYSDNLTSGVDITLKEMDRRNKILLASGARNTQEYFKRTGERIPLQIVIADELINFSRQDKAKLEKFACLSRAMGGVLFVATQYPTADLIPSQIQANVANRLVFRLVSSEYTGVALRRVKADNGLYEPSMIPKNKPGMAVLRRDSGIEVLGRAPELTDEHRDAWIVRLVAQYPKQVQTSVQDLPLPATTEQEMIQRWIAETPDISKRGLARKLYKIRGGKREDYTGDGPCFNEVKDYLEELGIEL